MIMAQNEETLYFDNTHPEVRQESKDKTQNAADKATWKKVAVGGAAGILLGASAMYATDAFAASTESARGGFAHGFRAGQQGVWYPQRTHPGMV